MILRAGLHPQMPFFPYHTSIFCFGFAILEPRFKHFHMVCHFVIYPLEAGLLYVCP